MYEGQVVMWEYSNNHIFTVPKNMYMNFCALVSFEFGLTWFWLKLEVRNSRFKERAEAWECLRQWERWTKCEGLGVCGVSVL